MYKYEPSRNYQNQTTLTCVTDILIAHENTDTRRERERKSALLLLASFIRNDPPARQVESWVTQTVAAKALLFGLD